MTTSRKRARTMAERRTAAAQSVIRDPVCGMTMDREADKPSHEHDGHVYHFCSAGCRDKFAAEPESYITATDPVCCMKVDRASAEHMAKHQGEFNGIVRARRLALATMRNIKHNLFFAPIYNTAGVPVAAGILYPFLGILISPIFAAFAMTASSLSVVLNALRLRTGKV